VAPSHWVIRSGCLVRAWYFISSMNFVDGAEGSGLRRCAVVVVKVTR
jgi:hypothetical protein